MACLAEQYVYYLALGPFELIVFHVKAITHAANGPNGPTLRERMTFANGTSSQAEITGITMELPLPVCTRCRLPPRMNGPIWGGCWD